MISVRPVLPTDAPYICDIYNFYIEKTYVTFDIEPIAEDVMRGKIDQVTQTHPWLVAMDETSVTGYAYLAPFHPRAAYSQTAEIAIYMNREKRGQGIGKRLYEQLMEEAIRLSIHSMVALIALPNPQSIALHESFGFQKVGQLKQAGFKFDTWIDVGYWQKMIG